MATFQERLQGLLGGGNQLGNIGLGLLASAGPRVPGTGNPLAEAFQFANAQNFNFQQNQLFQQQQQELERRRQAVEGISGILSGTSTVPISPDQQVSLETLDGSAPIEATVPGLLGQVPTALTPEGQMELQGLLAQANPTAFTQSAIQAQFAQQAAPRTNSAIQQAQFLTDPNVPTETKDALRSIITSDDGAFEQMMQLMEAQLLSGQLEDREAENLRREREEIRRINGHRLNTQTALTDLQTIVTESERLRGTALQAGVPFNDAMATLGAGFDSFANMLGFETPEERAALRTSFNNLTTASESFLNALADTTAGGSPTNARFNSLARAKLGPDTDPGTIAARGPKLAEDLILGAEFEGVDTAVLQGIFTGAPVPTVTPPAPTTQPAAAPAVLRPAGEMSLEEINAEIEAIKNGQVVP